jgi:phage portal protein BeeE
MVLNQPMNVSQVSHNIAELMIDESNLSDFRSICRQYSVPVAMFSDPTNSTYNNIEQSRKQWFESEFIALNNQIHNDLTWFLNSFRKYSGLVLQPDYSKIPELAKNVQQVHANLWPLVTSGIITRNEYLAEMKKDAVKDKSFDELYIFANNTWQPVNQILTPQTDE